MIRRKKSTIFLDAKEDTSVLEIKRMIHGITKVTPEDQTLYYKNEVLEDNKHLSDYGMNVNTAKAQSPATIGLAYNTDDGLDITPLSTPPDLPDVMKSPEGGTSGAGSGGASSQSDLQ